MTNKKIPHWIDLHLHTNNSDGTLSPIELVNLAAAQNISTIAITDHDTINGVKDAIREGEKKKLNVIPGIEISSKYTAGALHILGFGIDIEDPQLLKDLNQFQDIRKHRNHKIISILRSLGVEISVNEIMYFYPSIRSLGRPHIASILVKKGIVIDMNQAFIKYLGKNGKAFVEKDVISAEETVRMIHNAGGIAILAHPVTLNLTDQLFAEYLTKLMKVGLDGIEVYSSSHTPDQIQFYKDICRDNKLLISAGSDFHGSIKKNVHVGICNSGDRTTAEMVSKDLIALSVRK